MDSGRKIRCVVTGKCVHRSRRLRSREDRLVGAADFVMANPPFNQSEWSTPAILEDARWAHGTPPIGNWRPTLRASGRAAKGNGITEKPTRTRVRTEAKPPSEQTANVPAATSSLIAYPFPLKSGQIAQLHLPTQLEHEDAERLIQFVRALVFDQPRQLAASEPDAAK